MKKLRLLLVFVLALAAGCGPVNPLGRKAASGKVTLNGEPLKNGSIEFSPLAADGILSGAMIIDGAYAIATQKGLPPGKYTVRIFSVQSRGKKPDPKTPPSLKFPTPGVDLIPPEYNTKSEHTAEVTARGPNEFNYDISGQL